jgi:long-chain acyl-CoA synthetase
VNLDAETLAELPMLAAERFGDKIALVSGDVRLSFKQVEQLVSDLAREFDLLGIGPSDHVILHLPNGWEWVVAYYAIARVGAVVVPANILLVPAEVGYIASDCGAGAIIALAERRADILGAPGTERIKHYVTTRNTPDVYAYCDQRGFDKTNNHSLIHNQSADSIAMISYTSGTTGEPKGAVLTHRSIILNVQMTSTMHMRSNQDVIVTALPLAHVYGYIVLNSVFLCGSTIVVLERFEPLTLLSAVQTHRATILDGVPTMYCYLLDCKDLARYDVSSLTRCTVGGQTMAVSQMIQIEEALGCRLLELWGMTELAGLGTTHPSHGPRRLGSVGVAMPFTECRIAAVGDPSRILGFDEVGELMVRGPTMMIKYWGAPEVTDEAIYCGEWLHSGDVGYRDRDGYYYIIDRSRDMIITAGYNIYPSEIERVISQIPSVLMVGVGPISDANKGELPKAYIVLKDSAECSQQEVMAHCRAHLAAYKLPRAVEFVAELQRTPTGKIIRSRLTASSTRKHSGSH